MIFASEPELKLPYTFQWDTIQEAAWVVITSNILLSDFQCANPARITCCTLVTVSL